MQRPYNFSAGPAMLPEEVLRKYQQAILDYNGTGIGILEDSHRGKGFGAVAKRAESSLREILSIGDNYAVLFLNDGASRQFSTIPRNLKRGNESADFIETGYWSKMAFDESKKILEVRIAASTKGVGYSRVPTQDELALNPKAAYVHMTDNETIGGLEFPYVPETGNIPLVADMSSNFLSKPFYISKFGLVYASAQKNFGASAFCVVAVRKDLVGSAVPGTAAIDDYKKQIEKGSMYNTPNTPAWFLAGLLFEWIKEQGGLEEIAKLNSAKSEKLYQYIDSSGFMQIRLKRGIAQE